jgi:hypothetical protein
MLKLLLSDLTAADLNAVIDLEEWVTNAANWFLDQTVQITAAEQQQLHYIQTHLIPSRPHLMNEATIWSRFILPMLVLAEQGPIQAYTAVPLIARYRQFELVGVADGVLGLGLSGEVTTPYLIVLEAKRGIEAKNPQSQLYGQLLAAAHMNWEKNRQDPQEIWGCYTIADIWTFTRADITGIETDRPQMRVEPSREYSEKLEAPAILTILKQIVGRYIQQETLAA